MSGRFHVKLMEMIKIPQKKYIFIFSLLTFCWIIFVTVVMLNTSSMKIYNTEPVDIDDIRIVLRELDQTVSETDFRRIFRGNLTDKATWQFDFSKASKRRFGRKWYEITSADTEGRNLDFFNPIGFDRDSMILFEDEGPGIVERFFLQPDEFQFKSPKGSGNRVDDVFLLIEVDGNLVYNSKIDGALKDGQFKHPFFRPQIKKDQVGYYVSYPISYQHSIRISAKFSNMKTLNEKEIWEKTRHCKHSNKVCPFRVYTGISYNKFPYGTKLKTTFHDYSRSPASSKQSRNIVQEVNDVVSTMARTPELYGPGMTSHCNLTCYHVPEGEEVTIFVAENSSKVIQSLVFRVYDSPASTAKVSEHWERLLLTMTWDGGPAQVKDIPLASFFNTAFGHVRESNSLMAGMRKKMCAVTGKDISILDDRNAQWVAYLYYEMPFWSSARIVAKRPRSFGAAVICAQVTTKELNLTEYNPRLTGYFSAQLNQYDHWQAGHKTIFEVKNEWGHVIGVSMFVETVRDLNVQEHDIIIETDDAKAPMVSGSGTEDFFGYVHTFRKLHNSSLSMCGVPHCLKKIGARPWSCRFYRHMLFDPILFTKGILIYLERVSDRKKTLLLRKFANRSNTYSYKKQAGPSIAFLTMFYGRKGRGGITTDHVEYGDQKSTSIHSVRYIPSSTASFKIHSMFENQPGLYFTKWIISLNVGQTVEHTFKIHRKNIGVILRRNYRSLIRNQKAKVMVDGEDAGIWLCLQGAESEEFSLRINDHYLHPRLSFNKEKLLVSLKAMTKWESSSLEIISVVL